jgi:DNA-binding transcriptional LysR family regulator
MGITAIYVKYEITIIYRLHLYHGIAVDLRHLRYFLAVAEAGSFSAAAQRLRLSQPSLTVSVRALERELGEPLLVRGPRGVTLTPIGATFATYARSILREADKAVDEVRLVQGLKRGKVTVGLMSVFSSFVAPRALAEFHRRNPNIDVLADVSAHTAEEIVANLETGTWDFAFAFRRMASDFPDTLKVEPVATFESGVYAARAHPLAKAKAVEIGDMAKYDWIVSSLTAGATYLARIFDGAGVSRPAIKIVSNSFSLIRELAQEAPFLCMLPHRFAERDVATGRLVRIRQDAIRIDSHAGLISSARTQLTPAAGHLMDAFRRAAREEAGVPDG